MRKLLLYIGCAIVLVSMIAGCAGTDDGEGAAAGLGTVAGTVDTEALAPEDYDLLLDGQPIEVTIDTEGRFEIPHIPAGDHILDVIASDGMNAGRATFRIEAQKRTDIPPIRPIPTGQIAGVVTVAEDGQLRPLQDAEVVARSDLAWIMQDRHADTADAQPLIYPPPPGMTYRALTDQNGAYQMSGVNPGPYLVTVVAGGYTAAEAFVRVRPGRTATADFTLRPDPHPDTGTIAGTVVGGPDPEQASPIAGALVRINLRKPWRPPVPDPIQQPPPLGDSPDDDPDSSHIAAPDSAEPFEIALNVILTRTDDDGKYRVQVPAGRCVLSAWAYGYLPRTKRAVVTKGETTTVNFRLRPVPEPEPPEPPQPPAPPSAP